MVLVDTLLQVKELSFYSQFFKRNYIQNVKRENNRQLRILYAVKFKSKAEVKRFQHYKRAIRYLDVNRTKDVITFMKKTLKAYGETKDNLSKWSDMFISGKTRDSQ